MPNAVSKTNQPTKNKKDEAAAAAREKSDQEKEKAALMHKNYLIYNAKQKEKFLLQKEAKNEPFKHPPIDLEQQWKLH